MSSLYLKKTQARGDFQLNMSQRVIHSAQKSMRKNESESLLQPKEQTDYLIFLKLESSIFDLKQALK